MHALVHALFARFIRGAGKTSRVFSEASRGDYGIRSKLRRIAVQKNRMMSSDSQTETAQNLKSDDQITDG